MSRFGMVLAFGGCVAFFVTCFAGAFLNLPFSGAPLFVAVASLLAAFVGILIAAFNKSNNVDTQEPPDDSPR